MRLKACAKRAGNLTALARDAGLRQSTLRGYTIRPTEPPRDVLIRIAKAAKVSTEWLVTGEGPMDSAVPDSREPRVIDADEGMVEIANAIAKKYSVPVDFAFCRLNGSEELHALEEAMRGWSTSRPIPVIGGASKRNWGVLSKDEIEAVAPGSSLHDIAVYRIRMENLKPRFQTGDWALVDARKPISNGTYCVTALSGDVEIREIKITSGKILLSASRDSEGFGQAHEFAGEHTLRTNFSINGRLVGAIRFVASEQTGKTSPA